MLKDIKEDLGNSIKIMYADESFFRSETTLTHTWGDRETRKTIKVSSHSATVGVLGAVDPKKGDHEEMIIDGSIDSTVTNLFLQQLSKAYPKKEILLIWDNASFHKTQGSDKYPLPENISLLYLPPYSPDLNYSEEVWKIIKESDHKNILYKCKNDLLRIVTETFRKYKKRKFKFNCSEN